MKKTFIITLFSIFLSVFLFGCKVKTPSVEITLTSELNSVSYSLKFNDIEEDRNYKVTLSVAEKQVAEKVNTVKNNTGKFDNLEYNREYFLEVYIGEKANSKEYTTKLGESKISTNVLKFENVKLEGQTFTYDGTAKSISVTGAPEGTNIEYTGNGVTEVGEHTVSAKLTKEGYEDLTLTAKIVIVKSTVDFTIENVETVYSGQPVSVEVETELELTYEYYLGETKLESAPVNAGTYTVKAIYAGNAGVEGLTKSATLTIKKADTTITAANVTKVYDGTAAAVTATLSNGATPVVKYYNGTTELTEAPVAVGEYTAKVTYAGNENYNAAADVTVTITITKAAAAELTIANKEVTYNGEAQTITATTSLTVTYEYYNGTTKLDAAPVNAGTYTVKAIYAGDANHEAKTVEATLTIKKADVTITAANVTKVYDGTAATVTATLSNGATAAIAYQSDAAPVNAGTYTATVSYAGNENYNAAESVTVTITISKATVEFELADIETTYGQTYEVEADTELTVTYEYYNGTTKLDAAPVNAGTYTVKAIYAGDANHEGLTVEAELVIAKADTSITAPANVSKEYDEEPAVVIATVSNGGTPVIKYYKDNTELTEAPVEIGVYKAVISYVGNENYNAAESVTVTINITKPGYVALEITVDPITVTYGETYEVEGTVTGHNEVSFEDLTIEYYLGETKLDAKPVDAGTYTIIVSYEVNDDLFIAEAKVEVALVINQAEVELSLEDKEVTYNGNAHELTVDTEYDVTIEYYLGETKLDNKPVNAGTYTVKAIYAGDVNHKAYTAEAELVIKQVEVTFELEGNTEVTYDGNAHELTVDTEYDVTIEYYLGETKLDSKPVNAGTYTVKAIYAGDVNHKVYTATATLVIKQASVTLTVAETDIAVTYGETYTITATVSNDDNETIVIEYYKGSTKLEAAPTDAGSYTAKVTYSYGNYAAEPVTVTITIDAKVEFVMTGVQLRGKTFDPSVLSFKLVSSETNSSYVKCTSSMIIDAASIDTTQASLSITATYKEKTYTVTCPTFEKSPLMIYALYGGGGNKNATYFNDFIILLNNSAYDILLDGYSVQYISSNNTAPSSTTIVKLSGEIKAYGFYTIKCAKGTSTDNAPTIEIPFTPDQTSTGVNLSASGCHVVLAQTTTAVDLKALNDKTIDFVGIGSAPYSETEAAPAHDNTSYTKRNSIIDTNNNANDFVKVSLSNKELEYLSTPGYLVKSQFTSIINQIKEENGFDALVKDSMNLPITILGGIVVSWETSDEDIVSIDPTTGVATITRPQEELGEEDATVTLVAKINVGGVELTEECEILVKMIPANKDAATLEAAANLLASQIDTSEKVKENFTLPVLEGEEYANVVINWSTGDEELIDIVEGAAKVTRPRNIDGDTVVVLTATLSIGETVYDLPVTFNITVEKLEIATHAEYVEAADGKAITVQGIITRIKKDNKNLWLQTPEGSYQIFNSSAFSGEWLKVGEEVVFTGEKDFYNNALQVGSAKYVRTISSGNEITITNITDEVLENGFVVSQDAQGKLVELEGVIKSSKLMVGENSVTYYSYCDLPSFLKDNVPVKLTGVLTVFNTTNQLCLISISDIICLLTDAEKVAKDKESLDVAEEITTSLQLAFDGACGSTITWDSDSNVISIDNDKKEVKVEPANTDTTVELKATITCGSVSETRIFTVTVAAKGSVSEPKEIVFALGANGSEKHEDGSSQTTYNETVDGYKLSLSGGSGMYTGAIDAKGNSCIKLGTKNAAGKFVITVPSDVTKVVIYAAKYKTNTTKLKINSTSYTLTKNSNDGAYDEIIIDTTTTKKIDLTTVSGGYRCMINTIVFYA